MIEQKDVVVGGLMAIKGAANQEIRIRIEAAISFIESTHSDREIFKEQARAAGVELKAERDTSAALRKTLERVTRKLEKAKAKAVKSRVMLREACGAHKDDTFKSLMAYIEEMREARKRLTTMAIRVQDAIPDVRWGEDIHTDLVVRAIAAMNERSSAWMSVVSALDEHVPKWRTGDSETEALLAVEAIRKLAIDAAVERAIKTAPAPVNVPDGWTKANPALIINTDRYYDFILSDGSRVNSCQGVKAVTILSFDADTKEPYVVAYRLSGWPATDAEVKAVFETVSNS